MSPFNNAARQRDEAGSDPVSRPELERLEAGRRKPVVDRSLTPDGAQTVHAVEDARREGRIQDIETRLRAQTGKATESFATTRTRGRARHDFGHSR